MKREFLDLIQYLLLGACFAIFCFALATSSRSTYANRVHPHGELALVGYEYTGTQSASNAVFLCAKSFSVRYFMVRLKGTLSSVPVTCITGRPTLSALPPKLLGRNTGRAFVINTGAH